MAEGGFVVQFDGKEVCRCFAVAFDYDTWEYIVNEQDSQPIPEGVKAITVIPERG